MFSLVNNSPWTTVRTTLSGSVAALRDAAAKALPVTLVKLWTSDPRTVEIALAAPGQPILLVAGGKTQPYSLDALRALRRRHGSLLSARLTAPASLCLVRKRVLPAAAEARFQDILAAETARLLPFRPDAVRWGWRMHGQDTGDGTCLIEQYVLKRTHFEGVLADLSAADIPLRSLSVVDGNGTAPGVELLSKGERRRAPAALWLRKLLSAQMILIACGLAVGFAVSMNRLGSAIDREERDVAQVTKDLQAARNSQSQRETSARLMQHPRLRRLERPSVLAVWEDLTAILPNSTWLTDVRIEDMQAQIDGQSANAAELIAILSRSALFANATLAAPVTRDPVRGVERFQIKLTLKKIAAAQLSPAEASRP